MPDAATNQEILTAGLGGAAALLGGSVTVLSEEMNRKQVFATMISAVCFGSFVPPALMHYTGLHWVMSALVGFVLGLCCIPIVAGIRLVANRFAIKPGAFIPQIRDAMKDDSPAKKEGQP